MIEKYQEKVSHLDSILMMIYKTKIRIDGQATTVRDVFECTNGGTFKSSDYTTYSKEKLITIKNIDESGFNTDDTTYFILNSKYEKYLLKKKDILLTMTGAYLGRTGIVDEDFCYQNQRILKVKGKSNAFTYAFLKYNQETIFSLGKGSAQPNLGLEDFYNLAVPFTKTDIQEFMQFDVVFDLIVKYKEEIKKMKQIKALLLSKYF